MSWWIQLNEPRTPMASNLDLKNGFVLLSLARRKRDIGAALEGRPDVRLIVLASEPCRVE
jgi:hypothetical protein